MRLESILRRTVCDNKDVLCTKAYGMRTTAKVWQYVLAQPTPCYAYVIILGCDTAFLRIVKFGL